MTTLKAVMFDLDETLLNRTASIRLFLVDQMSRFPVLRQLDETALQEVFLELDRRGTVSKHLVYEQILKSISAEDAETASALFRDYENNCWRFAIAFPGLGELFDELKRSGLKTAIVTNGQTHIQLRSLLALNLDRLADIYLISEQENSRKPEPEIFQRAANRLNVDTSDCVFVGDSPITDIAGASRCGMRTIWFPNGSAWPGDVAQKPDATISRLSELPPLLEQWNWLSRSI